MLKNSVADPLWAVRVSYLGIVQGSEKVILPVSLKNFFEKNFRKVWQNEKKHLPLHPLSDKNGS
ncbi:hypothetical protein [Phocaeicola coprophilus]|uniref:hypothetical protein n=1 Tax=Phocaeicola coprophilus TaxID=387090 RepID=UPI003991CC68